MSISVEVLIPSRPVAIYTAETVGAPCVKGYVGIGKDHAPLAAELKPGILTVGLKNGESQTASDVTYFVRGGYLEVQQNRVVVLADGLEAPHEINEGRAKEAEQRALARLHRRPEAQTLDLNIPRALASLERARARLLLAKTKAPRF